MHPVKYEEIEIISKLVGEIFLDDPKNKYELRNVNRNLFILKVAAENEIKEFFDKSDLYTLDNYKGVVIGYNSRKIDFDEFIKIINIINDKIMKIITEEEQQTIINNSKMLGEVDNSFWFNEISREYYHLMIIGIDKRTRGSGAFRKLISPLIKECDKKNIPMILETHNKSNVNIYKHFGFKTIKEFSNQEVGFKQYCMIREPQ